MRDANSIEWDTVRHVNLQTEEEGEGEGEHDEKCAHPSQQQRAGPGTCRVRWQQNSAQAHSRFNYKSSLKVEIGGEIKE